MNFVTKHDVNQVYFYVPLLPNDFTIRHINLNCSMLLNFEAHFYIKALFFQLFR